MPVEVWESRWSEGRIGFDQSKAHPALFDLILGPDADRLGIPSKGKAVVPGCGRGYDVDLLSKKGLDALGVDISPTGVKAAQEWLDEQPNTNGQGKKEVIAADYFEWAKSVPGQWDVLLDYTFLCALPPDIRPQWSSAFSTLAKPTPSTRLITLIFPLPSPDFPFIPNKADRKGPPFQVTLEDYHELLDPHWTLIYCEDVSEEQRRSGVVKGDEKVGVWAWKG